LANVGKPKAGCVITMHHRKKPRKVTAATRRRGEKPADRTRGDVDIPGRLVREPQVA